MLSTNAYKLKKPPTFFRHASFFETLAFRHARVRFKNARFRPSELRLQSSSEPPLWGRQKGISSDFFRFVPISPFSSDLFRLAPLVVGNTTICSDSSDLFQVVFRTNQGNPFLPTLDGQKIANRQSLAILDRGLKSQPFSQFCCIGVFKTNRQSRVSNRSFKSQRRQQFESRVIKSLAILNLDRAI